MPAKVSPLHVACPSCTGCSVQARHRQADVGEAGLLLGGPACDLDDRSTASNGPLRGARFALVSLGLFLVPVLLAMTGAILGAGDQNGQFLGATSGLLVGMLGVMLVARVLRAKSPELPRGEAP